MALAVKSEVEAVLGRFAQRLCRVMDKAMEDWEAMPNKAKLLFPRDNSNIVFSYIAGRAIEEFQEDENVRIIDEPQTVKFLFCDTVLVRFKKGNSLGVGSNIQTQAVLDFVDPQLEFAGLPDVHRVEIVYQHDILGRGFSEISVVARDQSKRIWHYSLQDYVEAEILPFPEKMTPILTPPVVVPKLRPSAGLIEGEGSE